jgi:hypothetical protein
VTHLLRVNLRVIEGERVAHLLLPASECGLMALGGSLVSLSRVGLFRALLGVSIALVSAGAVKLFTQTIPYAKPPDAKAGEVVYKGGCIACHRADGKGAPESMTVFERRYTFPDMSRCDQTTPEPNSAYKTVIIHGGPENMRRRMA